MRHAFGDPLNGDEPMRAGDTPIVTIRAALPEVVTPSSRDVAPNSNQGGDRRVILQLESCGGSGAP